MVLPQETLRQANYTYLQKELLLQIAEVKHMLARNVNEQLDDTYFQTPQEKPAMVMQINLSLTVAINVPSGTLPTPASAVVEQKH